MTLQHLRTKVLQETDFKLLRCNGLLIYGIVNKIERALVITKQIFHYYNSNFSLICHKRGKRWSKMYIYTQTDPQPPDERNRRTHGSEANIGFGCALMPYIHQRQHFKIFRHSLYAYFCLKNLHCFSKVKSPPEHLHGKEFDCPMRAVFLISAQQLFRQMSIKMEQYICSNCHGQDAFCDAISCINKTQTNKKKILSQNEY